MNQKQTLIQKAFEAMKNAYAPYSNYHVGAAILLTNGTTILGANVENASYGATSCGERNAIFAAYSLGYRQQDIEAIAIVTDGKILAGPCGICRQVLSELIQQDTPIYLSNGHETMETTIAKLLPMQFGQRDLHVL